MTDLRFLRELGDEFERASDPVARRRIRPGIGGRPRAGGAFAFVGLAVSVLVVLAVGAVFLTEGHVKPRPGAGHRLPTPAGGPVPTGFQPAAVTAINAQSWWVLGPVRGCGGQGCASIVRTTDGGRQFVAIPTPHVPYDPEPSAQGRGVAALIFATARDGYAYYTSLFVTHDGGASWHEPRLPGGGGRVVDVAAGGGEVYAIVQRADGTQLLRSPVGRDAWSAVAATKSAMRVAARGPEVLLTVKPGSDAYILASYDRGAHFTVRYRAPNRFGCSFDPVSGSVIWVLCPRGMRTVLYRSTDGGRTLRYVAPVPLQTNGVGFAAASANTVLAGSRQLYRTDNAGLIFTRVRPASLDGFQGLLPVLFTDSSHGLALGSTQARYPRSYLFRTVDGGRTYQKVTIEGPGLAQAALQDLSWLSPTEGFALAAQPCAHGSCVRLAHTFDGGRQWQALPDPPAHLPVGSVDCSKVACVSNVRFASPAIGYLYGPGLLMTTDGGDSWHAQRGPQVETLTVFDGNVYRVAYDHTGCPGPCQPILQEAQIGSSTWRTLIAQLAYPDRSGTAQIVGSGSALLLALYGSQAGPVSAQASAYRSSDGGASWQRRTDPCSGRGPGGRGQEEDLVDLAAAPSGFFAGLCSPHTGSGTFVITSTDAGRFWKTAGALPAGQGFALLAAAGPTTIVVSTPPTSGGGTYTARLLVSTDGGQHWSTGATDTQQITQAGVPAWLGFQSASTGSWIGDPQGVWTTTDGGSHWAREAFR